MKDYDFRGILVLKYPFIVIPRRTSLLDQDLSVEVTYTGDVRLGGCAEEEKLSTLVGEK